MFGLPRNPAATGWAGCLQSGMGLGELPASQSIHLRAILDEYLKSEGACAELPLGHPRIGASSNWKRCLLIGSV